MKLTYVDSAQAQIKELPDLPASVMRYNILQSLTCQLLCVYTHVDLILMNHSALWENLD